MLAFLALIVLGTTVAAHYGPCQRLSERKEWYESFFLSPGPIYAIISGER
jgi:hypothetical protein